MSVLVLIDIFLVAVWSVNVARGFQGRLDRFEGGVAYALLAFHAGLRLLVEVGK